MISAILIGAGARGIGVYGDYAINHPDKIKFVAVAEPDGERRMYFAMVHKLLPEQTYLSDTEILNQPKMADCCFICTQDNLHVEPALKAMDLGYHVFLEKPMAVTPKDCLALYARAQQRGVKVMIGHVLRYTPFFAKIKDWLDEGAIGELMTIQHNENVSFWHQAHSYVRGNWRNEKESSPMILAKSCHDLDLLCWFAGAKPEKVSSFGELSHFRKENVPEGAPPFCMEGCPHQDDCLYYAPRVYLNAPIWMKLPVANDMSNEGLLKALKAGPYGRCVYQSDNDVVDHQVTIIEFAGGITAAFTMTGFTNDNTRTIKLMGTAGEIRGHLEKNELELVRFGKGKKDVLNLGAAASEHGGGDKGIMDDFVNYVDADVFKEKFSLKDSLTSHLLAFAAEKSRKQSRTVAFDDYLKSLETPVYGTCAKSEYFDAISLATTVFGENMAEQYPLLLGRENCDRIFVATINGKVKAMVNYYPARILIGEALLSAASIGAVATDVNYRNQGYASHLLQLAEADMHKNNVSLAIISGYDGIYHSFGATRVGHVHGYEIKGTERKTKVTIKTYEESDFADLLQIYAGEKIRYQRTYQEFQKLLHGQLLPVKMTRCHMEVIYMNNEAVAYVFFKDYLDKDELLVREIAGNRQYLLEAFPLVLTKYGKSKLHIPVDAHDAFSERVGRDPEQITDQHASFKVLDWNLFLKELKPYFVSRGVDKISVSQPNKNAKYVFSCNDLELEFDDVHELHRLFFGPNDEILKRINNQELQNTIKTILPIPFVWTNNLNYQ